MLDKAGYIVETKSGVLRVTKGSSKIMKEVIKNDIYTLVGKTIIG